MRRFLVIPPIGRIPVYPLLIAAFPVVALAGTNISEVEPVVMWRPLAFEVLGAIALLLILRFLSGDWHRAALITSVLLLLFFSYGHAYAYLKKIQISGFLLGRHRHLLPLWLLLAALGFWWGKYRARQPGALTPVLNLVSMFLLIYPSLQIISFSIRKETTDRTALAAAQVAGTSLPLGYAPDVYYVILDAYGRQDVLLEMFEYDNTPFLRELESRGFYVAECAQSNYGQTLLSLTSSLNFDYLSSLSDLLTPDSDARAPLRALGQYNRARRFLASQGYNIVSFATNFPVSEWKDANHYLSPPPTGMSDFEIMLAQTSAWRIPMDMIDSPPEKRSAEWYRRRTLFTLAQMESTVPNIESPKFVFAHLVIPHHPFVFGPNGEELDHFQMGVPEFDEYRERYPDQVTYINMRLLAILDLILSRSERPPIIVIQGDHGPAPFDIITRRMKILNAYYFPGGPAGLYSSISPVNTFRMIFDRYFGQEYPLLDDRALYSAYDVPYDYVEVPNDCR